ncbi:general odorant-binding protein 69a-like [Leguminivora glycinivorella]|uniref:general odorant-binding protein 69a-like n=1 Tax=Leguminivora glycinivorella TaxID=1035111 RepID=UPI00200E3E73|nr:general odorant-binding protein 69a-like [Leguminivora glycinivorella]
MREVFCSAVMALYLIGFVTGQKTCTEGMDEETVELAKMLRDNCGEESEVDMGLIAKVNDGADLMPDPKLKCYMKCVMETAGMLDNGDVDIEATLELLPEAVRSRHEPIVRTCGSKRGADDCETAFNTQACWQQMNKAEYCLI